MSTRALVQKSQDVEGLPFERRPEDSEEGWALFLEWLEAPSDVTLQKWCNNLPKDQRGTALVEGAENEWTRRKMAYYRYSAEMASCQAASKSAKAMLRTIGRWDQILDRLTDDLNEDSKNYTDAEIERLRVVTEALERILKATTGNKFITAIQINTSNSFGRRTHDGPPVLGAGWNPEVIEG